MTTQPKPTSYGWGKIVHIMSTILHTGPSSPAEHWIHELAKYARRDPSALYITFSPSTLKEGFRISNSVFPTCPDFFPDVCELIDMLPIKNGDVVERSLLIDLLKEAAKEIGCRWWGCLREMAGVMFGVVHAGLIERRESEEKELAGMFGRLDVGDEVGEMGRLFDAVKIGEEERSVLERCAEAVGEGVLSRND
ncbi:hypothetical protein P280DRAFT_517227 [Massarina eburnea CBS 473.64]|uniref:Uncharacterized protein n=1 Tax=Massarina eburnea CBS 473.64 TaxID=1395130 RepID=A0A6A6RZI6_9PLEO|nr:hypothetical protein P280DRAFT_517227 [Massarina eburnea CBS 473.64]